MHGVLRPAPRKEENAASGPLQLALFGGYPFFHFVVPSVNMMCRTLFPTTKSYFLCVHPARSEGHRGLPISKGTVELNMDALPSDKDSFLAASHNSVHLHQAIISRNGIERTSKMVSTLIIGLRCKSSGFYNSNIWCSVLEIYIKKVLSSVVVTQKKKFGGMFFFGKVWSIGGESGNQPRINAGLSLPAKVAGGALPSTNITT